MRFLTQAALLVSLVLPPILAARFAFEEAYFAFASWDAMMFATRQTLASGDPAKALDLAKRALARTRPEARGGARQNREALTDSAALLASCYLKSRFDCIGPCKTVVQQEPG